MTMDMFYLLLIVVAIIIIVAVNKKQSKTRAEERFDSHVENLKHNYGRISQCIPYIDIPDSVFVFEESRYIVIGYASCRFEQILDVRLDVITHGGTGTTIRNVIIGDMLFGKLGALMAASNSSNDQREEYMVSIIIDDLSNPVIKYRTEDYNIAHRVLGIFRGIIDRNKK